MKTNLAVPTVAQSPQSSSLQALIRRYQPGQSLPQEFYTDEVVFQADLRQIFYRSWLFVGHSCEVAQPGDYLTVTVGDESLVVVRDRDRLHAHFNVCRHRGSRIALASCGQAKALVCPYHQWSYQLDGQLRGARLMGREFDRAEHGLISAQVRELAGLIFVCLAAQPPDFEAAVDAISPQLTPHRLDQAKIIARHTYTVSANWKTLIENNRECYHCAGAHPEFFLSNYDFGLPGDTRATRRYQKSLAESYQRWQAMGLAPREVSFPDGGWFRVARLPLKPPFLTESLTGQLTAPLMGDFTQPEVGSLRIIGLPNFWGHANADYAMTTRVIPLAVNQTQIDVAFLIHPDAVEGRDYSPADVAAVWQATSEQDWQLCENNYAGIRSSAYRPGPLSPLTESSVTRFLTWYLHQLN